MFCSPGRPSPPASPWFSAHRRRLPPRWAACRAAVCCAASRAVPWHGLSIACGHGLIIYRLQHVCSPLVHVCNHGLVQLRSQRLGRLQHLRTPRFPKHSAPLETLLLFRSDHNDGRKTRRAQHLFILLLTACCCCRCCASACCSDCTARRSSVRASASSACSRSARATFNCASAKGGVRHLPGRRTSGRGCWVQRLAECTHLLELRLLLLQLLLQSSHLLQHARSVVRGVLWRRDT